MFFVLKEFFQVVEDFKEMRATSEEQFNERLRKLGAYLKAFVRNHKAYATREKWDDLSQLEFWFTINKFCSSKQVSRKPPELIKLVEVIIC